MKSLAVNWLFGIARLQREADVRRRLEQPVRMVLGVRQPGEHAVFRRLIRAKPTSAKSHNTTR